MVGHMVGIAAAGMAGIGLGALYFAGLWYTVWRLPTTSCPALLALGSFWVRAVGCLFGFYLVAGGGHWERLLACLLGFVGIRTFFVYYWGPSQPAYALARRGE